MLWLVIVLQGQMWSFTNLASAIAFAVAAVALATSSALLQAALPLLAAGSSVRKHRPDLYHVASDFKLSVDCHLRHVGGSSAGHFPSGLVQTLAIHTSHRIPYHTNCLQFGGFATVADYVKSFQQGEWGVLARHSTACHCRELFEGVHDDYGHRRRHSTLGFHCRRPHQWSALGGLRCWGSKTRFDDLCSLNCVFVGSTITDIFLSEASWSEALR